MSRHQSRPQASPAAEHHCSTASSEAITEVAVRVVRESAYRAVAEIVGEVDYDCADDLGGALDAALDGLPLPLILELDLTGLSFCDCAGLNALLRLRERAAAIGCVVRVRAASPPVSRLFDLTDTRQLFTGSVNGGTAPK